MDAFGRLVESLSRRRVRFVVIGLSGANYYARSAATLFATQDRDVFLKPVPKNVLAAWEACGAVGLELFCAGEPLDHPRDRVLAERVVENKALVRATDSAGLDVDLTLLMEGFEFATVWRGRRTFRVDQVEIPVARLTHIVESKRRTGRAKDRLFFATHADAIRELVVSETSVRSGKRTPRGPTPRRSTGKRPPK